MSDYVSGDQYKQTGAHSVFTVNNSAGLSRPEVDAAIAELRAFVTQLTREGAVAADGTVTDPGAVVAAVESRSGRLKALGRAIAGGARDAVLSAVQSGVATLVVALLGRT